MNSEQQQQAGVISAKAGDVVVLTTPAAITSLEAQRIRREMEGVLPSGVYCVVLQQGMALANSTDAQDRIVAALERLVYLADAANPDYEEVEADIVVDPRGQPMRVTGTHEGEVMDLLVVAPDGAAACLAARDYWRQHGLDPHDITATWDDS